MIGKTLGPYEILEPLGAGGMGEVYRAQDTRLGRKVAVKVLPEEFASMPERLARFEQEARAAAALNHPHIAVIHDVGFEPAVDDGGETAATAGVHYMVQEYLEGQTLRETLDKGALPPKKAVDLAAEIAEALAAAHEAGIVHRDLKPANVFVSPKGHAKVLDFGLAKLTEAVMPGSGGGSDSRSPTMLGTVAGQVMGTAGYMAPEQVEGEDVDHRADIFAFGCLLYEAVTGKQAFAGKNVLDTLHKIANSEPQPLVELDQQLPVDLQRILRKCLAKERSARYQTAGDLVVDLKALAAEIEGGTALPLSAVSATMPQGAAGGAAPGGGARAGRGVSMGVAAALVAITAVVVGLGSWLLRPPSQTDAVVHRFEIPAPGFDNFVQIGVPFLAISRQGTDVYFSAAEGTEAGLMHRAMDGLSVQPVPGAPAMGIPRVSPDGEWIAGGSGAGALNVVSRLGGAPRQVVSQGALGADWLDNDTLVYTDGRALFRVYSAGGEAQKSCDVQGTEGLIYAIPRLLPGGRHVLMTELEGIGVQGSTRVVAVSLDNCAIDAVVSPNGAQALYAESGHVIYLRDATVEAVPFDPAGLEALGPPVPILPDALVVTGISAQIDVSRNGTLVYLAGALPASTGRTLTWVDRDGSAAEVFPVPGVVQRPRISPDGARVVLEVIESGARQVRVYDLERGTFIPMPNAGGDVDPIWTPDGESITFASSRGGVERLFIRAADGTGEETALPPADFNQTPYSWSPNGELAIYTRPADGGNRDISVLSRDDQWSARVVLGSQFNERSPAFSPDGRWLAYASDEGGQDNVYVMRWPGLDQRITVSPDGGSAPAWSAEGDELYYISLDGDMMAVSVQAGDRLTVGRPEALFSMEGYVAERVVSGSRPYDVAADGRFLVLRDPQRVRGTTTSITVVTNWLDELRRLAPPRR